MSALERQRANRRLTVLVLLMVAGMFAFGFALVPLYEVFCRVTGLNGKTAEAPARIEDVPLRVVEDRWVTVEFLSNPGNAANWMFEPEIRKLKVHPGQAYLNHYRARNPSDRPKVARAVPSVAPGLAAAHLHKTECFCFNRQRFAPGETRRLTLRFMLDPEMPSQVGIMSLAYTLYVQDAGEARVRLAGSEAAGSDTGATAAGDSQ